MKTFCAVVCILSTVYANMHSIEVGNSDMIIGFVCGALVFGISSPIILFWKD